MKKIRFQIDYKTFKAGNVIGTKDSDAALLVNAGIAKYEADHVRPLTYKAEAKVQSECVAVVMEEVEASPKGAVLPEEIEEKQPSKQTAKKSKKQTK